MKHILKFLCLCSGARKDALDSLPASMAQAATLGVLMILTSTVSALTAGYALSRAFLGDEFATQLAIAGGLLWGSIVFCIDRLLILGMDKFTSRWHLVPQILIRMIFAVVIALVMSKPLVLRLARSPIEAELISERDEMLEKSRIANTRAADIDSIQQTERDLQASRTALQRRLGATPDSPRYLKARNDLRDREAAFRKVTAANETTIVRASAGVDLIRSAGAGEPLDAKSTERIRSLQSQIQACRIEIQRANSAVAAPREEMDQAERAWRRSLTDEMNMTDGNLKEVSDSRQSAETKLRRDNRKAEDEITRIMQSDLINQWRIKCRITSDPKNLDASAIKAFELGLDILFSVLEFTVVFLKAIGKKLPLDHGIAALESIEQERINLHANTEIVRLQTTAEAVSTVNEQTIARWRDGILDDVRAGRITAQDVHRLRQELAGMVV